MTLLQTLIHTKLVAQGYKNDRESVTRELCFLSQPVLFFRRRSTPPLTYLIHSSFSLLSVCCDEGTKSIGRFAYAYNVLRKPFASAKKPLEKDHRQVDNKFAVAP